MKKKIDLLIAEKDSSFREKLMNRFLSNPNIIAHGTDSYPCGSLTGDVILLDGDSFPARTIIGQTDLPCVIMSDGSISEADALSAGAAGFVKKPPSTSDCVTFCSLTAAKIIFAYSRKVKSDWEKHRPGTKNEIHDISEACGKITPVMPSAEIAAAAARAGQNGAVVALGASTGGTDALECVIKAFPADMPPVVVVQHMPPKFTALYAERLNRVCAVEVLEAEDGMRLHCGRCVIGAGGLHLTLCRDKNGYFVHCKAGEKVSGFCPSVDVLFSSVAETAGKKAVGALMTGMGADGATGLLKMRQAGAHTIGQDEQSCVVYGMPMEAQKIGACVEQVSLRDIGATVCARAANIK